METYHCLAALVLTSISAAEIVPTSSGAMVHPSGSKFLGPLVITAHRCARNAIRLEDLLQVAASVGLRANCAVPSNCEMRSAESSPCKTTLSVRPNEAITAFERASN